MCAQGQMVKVLFLLTLLTPGCTTWLAGALAADSSSSSSRSKQVDVESLDDDGVKSVCMDAKHEQKSKGCLVYGQRLGKRLVDPPCGQLNASLEELRAQVVKTIEPQDDRRLIHCQIDLAASPRALECEEASLLFGEILTRHTNRDSFAHSLLELLKAATAGAPEGVQRLDAALVTYLAENPTGVFAKNEDSWLVARGYRRYRTEVSRAQKLACQPLGAALVKTDIKSFQAAELLNVLQAFECAEGVPLAERGLMDKAVDTRYNACLLLRDHGSAKHAKNLEILAKTDPHTATVRGNVVYPVRDICAQALGQIMMRAD